MSSGSVTAWIVSLKAGDASAAQPLWERYFGRLVGLARHKLAASSQRLADEEDIALSAFKSLCRGATEGRFPRLTDRDDLWPLLVVLASHKAVDLLRSEGRAKRGGQNHSAAGSGSVDDIQTVLSQEPTPEFAALMNDYCDWLLSQLDAGPREVALLKLEGCTNEEVAARLNCGIRTVERRLELIRRVWAEVAEQEKTELRSVVP
jgi:DNA-directed RNA polymerase specialized sigma24 family protein